MGVTNPTIEAVRAAIVAMPPATRTETAIARVAIAAVLDNLPRGEMARALYDDANPGHWKPWGHGHSVWHDKWRVRAGVVISAARATLLPGDA